MKTPSTTDRSVWVVVVAGGSGTRYGTPKQYEIVAGRPVLDWSIGVASRSADGVVVVVPDAHVGTISANYTDAGVTVVAGGATRSDSVRCGMAAVPADAGVVLIHDAARPAATLELFTRVIDAVRAGMDEDPPVGVVPVVPVTDSLRHPSEGAVDRTELRAVQTPQGFPIGPFREALTADGDATDDATLFEAAGGRIVCVDGEVTNVKLTHRTDHATLAFALGTGGMGDGGMVSAR